MLKGSPVLLTVRAKELHGGEQDFFFSRNGVWLTGLITADYIVFPDEAAAVRTAKSCGVICVCRVPELEFLLLEHEDRFDWPKGHMEAGETEGACALREFEEETGIPRGALDRDPDFRYETSYLVRYLAVAFGDQAKKQVNRSTTCWPRKRAEQNYARRKLYGNTN